MYVTNKHHGGKVCCHKCGQFIEEEDAAEYSPFHPGVFFHNDCYNPYEHYYGLDKPID